MKTENVPQASQPILISHGKKRDNVVVPFLVSMGVWGLIITLACWSSLV
jgi:hypothetical protein